MQPTLGLLYKFPIEDIDDDSQDGVFVGTYRDYNLFAQYVHSNYNEVNNYNVFYIKKDKEIELINVDVDFLSIDNLIWFVGYPTFPHPATLNNRETTSVRVNDRDIKKAWIKHLYAKSVVLSIAAAPPSLDGKFSGGPLYKRDKREAKNYKSTKGGSKTRRIKKNKNKKQQ